MSSTRYRTWRGWAGRRGTTSSTWQDGEWLGFGCGAHSTRAGVRWRNVPATMDYIQRIAAGAPVIAERRVLDTEERVEEALFTGLRLTAGSGGDRRALWCRCLAPLRCRTRPVRGSRSPGPRARSAVGVDPGRHAVGQRGHGGFIMARQHGSIDLFV